MSAADVAAFVCAPIGLAASIVSLRLGVTHHDRRTLRRFRVFPMLTVPFAVLAILTGTVPTLMVGTWGLAMVADLVFGACFVAVAAIQLRILAAVRQHAAWLSLAERAEDPR